MMDVASWHPYSETFAIMNGDERERIKRSIINDGQVHPAKFMVKAGERIGLDGRNRLSICTEIGIECRWEEVKGLGTEDEIIRFINRENLARRRETDESLRPQAIYLSKLGWSYRRIADETGLHASTIARYLSGVSFETPEVTGKDGKSYRRDGKKKAKKPKPREPKVCNRCKRLGPLKHCPVCKILNSTKRKPKHKKDEAGSEIHPRVLDALEQAATWETCAIKIEEARGLLAVIETTELYQSVSKDVMSGLLVNVRANLLSVTPVSQCKSCTGFEASEDAEQCKKCGGHGFICRGEK